MATEDPGAVLRQSSVEKEMDKLGDEANNNAQRNRKDVKDFTFGRVLGEGSYGAVVLGKDAQGKEYAIKMLEKKHLVKEKKVKYATTERDILTQCNHPNIVKLFYTFKDDEHLYYVMELCSNGELLGKLKQTGTFDEVVTGFYTLELINSLEYLHQKGIVHRDLKPENLLLDKSMHLKLTDFGTAKIIGTEKNARSNSFVGTAEYVSPELLSEKLTSKSSDLWALGCIVYQMLGGRPPFRAGSEFLVFQKIQQREFSYPQGFSDLGKDLIDKLLVLDPERRLGASEKGYDDLKKHQLFKPYDPTTIHTITPPALKAFSKQLVFDEDVLAEKEAHNKKIQEEESKKWKKFLMEDELIVVSGLVWKRKGRSVKKRQLLFTNKPRLIYVDVKKLVQKGEVPWSPTLRPEAKNERDFFIHTPKRTYILEDIDGKAQRWVDAINKQLEIHGKK